MAAQASTVTLDFGPESSTDAGASFTFTLAAPTGITGDATISFTVKGDLGGVSGGSGEYVDVSLDGALFGRVFDNDEDNDTFDFPADSGNQASDLTGSATIVHADMVDLIADNSIVLTFDFSQNVKSVDNLEGAISYETTAAAVPLPASLPLLGGGLLALLGLARRRRA